MFLTCRIEPTSGREVLQSVNEICWVQTSSVEQSLDCATR